MPLIFFSGCKRNCPSLNIRGPHLLGLPAFFFTAVSLFTIEFFQKDFYDTPFTPSPPFAERHLWKISRYSFDRKLKAARGTGGADLGFVFLKKKKTSWGRGGARGHPEGPDSDLLAASG